MNKQQKEIIIKTLESSSKLYKCFSEWLDKQDLDIEFILHEDRAIYFDMLWFEFIKNINLIGVTDEDN